MAQETENPADDETHSTRMAFALLGFGLLATFALLVPIPLDGQFWAAIGDLAHAPLFALIMLVPLLISGRQFAETDTAMSIIVRTLTVAICVFLFGVGIELAQTISGRTASFHDIICNGLGVIAGLLLYFAIVLWRRPNSAFSVLVLVSLAVGAIATASGDSALLLRDVWSMHRNFPQLASFETEMELQRFYYRKCGGRQSELDVTDGEYSMEVVYDADSYVTATMTEMVRDWSGLRTFEIDVALDESYNDKSLTFVIQIGSASDTVYRDQWTLYPGQPQQISITRQQMNEGASGGVMDFSKIQYIDLAVIDPIEQVRLRFDSIRLTLKQPVAE